MRGAASLDGETSSHRIELQERRAKHCRESVTHVPSLDPSRAVTGKERQRIFRIPASLYLASSAARSRLGFSALFGLTFELGAGFVALFSPKGINHLGGQMAGISPFTTFQNFLRNP